jgi:hypothetical protein
MKHKQKNVFRCSTFFIWGFVWYRRSPADAWKFGAIFTPIVYIKMVNDGLDNKAYSPKKVSPLLTSLVLAPMFTGWCFCVGSAMGRYGRERLGVGDV